MFAGTRVISREELTEKLRHWARAIFQVELEEFLEGYQLGRFNHNLASIAGFLGLGATR